MAPNYTIEAFDPSRHERSNFSCGTSRIDNFLRLTAKKHQKGNFTRIWVACAQGAVEVLGFYSLNAHSLELDGLPRSVTRNAPSRESISAVYLSMIGVSQSLQGHGLGRLLMADALKRVAQTSEDIGVAVLVLDVLDDDGAFEKRKTFYTNLGFASLDSRPERMFIPTATIRNQLASTT